MKKVKILSIVCVMILAAVIFMGCASKQEDTAEVSVIGGADEPTDIIIEENTGTEEAAFLEGTVWSLISMTDAAGEEITEDLPEFTYEFKADGKVLRTAGDGSAEGTYEVDGNSVIMNFDGGETQLGVVENGELEVFEGKGAYFFAEK